MQKILVTGGAGYIGSHSCVELLSAGYEVVVVDNLSNSDALALERVEQITGRMVEFHQVDIRDQAQLDQLFSEHEFFAVIHFAGLKAVGESVKEPLKYYDNNIYGTQVLLAAMQKYQVFNLVFSSSATVYGDPQSVPITEQFPLSAVNPYGRSKLFIEDMLRDLAAADARWSVVLLRYFNPVGAHESGLIGEDPKDIPNNLVPYISQVALKKLASLSVFGSDYPTHDGTGVRDYIHVVDLAKGHLAALKKLITEPSIVAYNLGTGIGYSVLDMVAAFEKACGQPIPYQLVSRRPGDAAICYADASLAKQALNWQAELDLEAMIRDAWRWQSNNPYGYQSH
ncbi:MAG: UDP-glucose 4-epimerase GalE [Cellvibrionales bacterium]|nr:UDP-glucose 4-epimerase GalE [Cellvibrionales bacterium]|tara:strand:+ start:5812 stop:6831 length:1020 start_codon:yes stop_codon:yes gene_type:complete